MKRRIRNLLLILLAAAAIFFIFRTIIRVYNQRQINGRLSYDNSAVPTTAYAAGDFILTWDSEQGQLSVHHQATPGKVLWATIPGEGFVAAARGQETVEEARGSFFISDRLQGTCTRQSIDTIEQAGGVLTVHGQLRCNRSLDPVAYQLSFQQTADNQLQFQLTINDPDYNRVYLTYSAAEDEQFFGFGEQFSYFNMKGRRLPIFIMEQGIGRGAQPVTAVVNLVANSGGSWHTTYAAVPHYISSRLRSLFLENSHYMVFDMRQVDRVHIQLFNNSMTGRILHGNSPADLIQTYTEYSGRMRPLPDWILDGAIIGMQGGTDKVRQVWQQLQAEDTPIAAFWLQDWVGQRPTSFGKQLWWNWELDRDHYPGWDELVADLAAENIRVMTYANPFLADVSQKENYNHNLFQEAAEQGFLVKNEAGDPYLIQNTSFAAGLLDLTNPEAVAWMENVLAAELLAVGASGWMADFGEALPYDARLHSGLSPAEFHNRYPVAWAELNRRVVDSAPNSDQLVFFSRAGFTRSPQFTTLFWLGDQLVSWDRQDGIKTAVTGLLSSGLSGYSFNHSDTGGYTTLTSPIQNYHRDRELLWRWMEMNAFTTIFRTHEGNQPEANHQFYSDPETLAQFARFAKIYAAWAFYRHELVQEAAETGLPVVRHPFIHYPAEMAVYDLSYHQFMVGSELMVAPVLDPDTADVTVYLPAGRWVHIWSGEVYGDASEGGVFTLPAPLGEPAVLYRAGSAVGEQFVANLQSAGLLD